MTFDAVAVSTTTPLDVVAHYTLGVGRNYGMQFQGPGTLAIRESDSMTTPDLTDSHTTMDAHDTVRLTPKANEGIWLWVIARGPRLAAGARVVVWEEP